MSELKLLQKECVMETGREFKQRMHKRRIRESEKKVKRNEAKKSLQISA